MSIYRVATPAFRLSVEKGTPDVPDDGLYHVLFQGELVASERSEKKALKVYRARRRELIDSGWELAKPQRLSREEQIGRIRTESDIQQIQSVKTSQVERKRKGR